VIDYVCVTVYCPLYIVSVVPLGYVCISSWISRYVLSIVPYEASVDEAWFHGDEQEGARILYIEQYSACPLRLATRFSRSQHPDRHRTLEHDGRLVAIASRNRLENHDFDELSLLSALLAWPGFT